ncbi:hypothetical protein V8E54_009815 [Elaphomyces granulatus]
MNQTIPDESGRVHGWIAEPSGRGTAGLLYNCLVTIFLCVWSALHINILERNASWMQNLLYKAGLALFAIIAPEVIFFKAVDSYFFIRDTLNELPASFVKGELKYTETHLWFIMMGGFEIQCTDDIHRLDVADIKHLITQNAISLSSIAITEEEISARSKTDRLSKLITCLQILWFVIQLIGRAVQHLPTSNLELFTLGLVVCSLGTYAAYWRRPKDISLPITIPVGEGKALSDVFGKSISPRARLFWNETTSERRPFSLGLAAVITCIFGGCHLIGWDFLYPSLVEQLLWRISSISCLVTPFLLYLLLAFVLKYESPETSFAYFLPMLVFILLCPFYVLVRTYLLVEVFVSLRSVPAGVYQTVNWSLYFPHL